MVSILASPFQHPPSRLFEVGGDIGLLVIPEVLERVTDAIRFGDRVFPIPCRIPNDSSVEGDLSATPVHLFAQDLFSRAGKGDRRRKFSVLEKQPKRRIKLRERQINPTVSLGSHESHSVLVIAFPADAHDGDIARVRRGKSLLL
ncbi:hypothetical protein BCO9919_01990 [Burkholderia cenocepacia]|uniref:Uncharacterized protein n=1 Tax=Burkholderia cenocepacia TaxID=95486 RepID=A0A6J5J2M9_9BURK|nr:hypothetical protein BCO9919_01990 [Burkholderia cenocepacia]